MFTTNLFTCLVYNTKTSEYTMLYDWHVADALFGLLNLPE